jgi:hypothetical protein
MSISTSRRSQTGVALLTAIIIVIVVGGMAAAFLSLSLAQTKAISTGSDREIALHVAEAGIEDAINKLTGYSIDWVNQGNKEPVWAGTPPDYNVIGISAPVNSLVNVAGGIDAQGNLSKNKWVNQVNQTATINGTVNGGTYTVAVTSTSAVAMVDPAGNTVVFSGPFPPPTGQPDQYGYAPRTGYKLISSGTFNGVTRSLQIVTSAVNNANPFQGGLFGDVQVDALGTFFSDGYNSAKGSYASQAKNSYTFPSTGKTFTYADTTGSIGSNHNIITNGNVTIMGNSTPGPGSTSGPGGSIWGSTAPATAPTPLQPVTYTVPAGAASAPSWLNNTGMTLAPPAGQTSTTLHMSSFSPTGKGTITVNGNVTLYVDGSFSMNNQQALNITAGSSLTIYQGPGANDITINGQAVAGATGSSPSASQFQVYSASTGTIKFNGGSQVYAAVYAPQAAFTNNGGNEFFGAMVASTMQLTGTASFHYDENLQLLVKPVPDYKIVSWMEITNLIQN